MPAAPAALRGLRITGKPTASTKARASSGELAPAEAAQGIPDWRNASFIAGLSRHSQVVSTDVPGIPVASRTLAAGSMWASTVASRRSTQPSAWMARTTPRSAPSSTTDPSCR